jgi:hypothetical protein
MDKKEFSRIRLYLGKTQRQMGTVIGRFAETRPES